MIGWEWIGPVMTALGLMVWNAELWITRVLLQFEDAFLSPDLRIDGPGKPAFEITLGISLAVFSLLFLWQLASAAWHRSGRALGAAVAGLVKFAVAYFCGMTLIVLLVQASNQLTRAIMMRTMRVDNLSAVDLLLGMPATDGVNDPVVAIALVLFGFFMVLAVIGHVFVLLARGSALIVLVATAPISWAGLAAEVTASWFQKSCRWLLTAIFTPALMALVMGLGLQFLNGSVVIRDGDLGGHVGSVMCSAFVVAASAASPAGMFYLLAFVDGGTASGAEVRARVAAVGGVTGLLRGKNPFAGNSQATSSGGAGSAGEGAADHQTSSLLSKIGGGLAQGLEIADRVGSQAAAVQPDVANQAGYGNRGGQPMPGPKRLSSGGSGRPEQQHSPGHDTGRPAGNQPDSLADDRMSVEAPMPAESSSAAGSDGASVYGLTGSPVAAQSADADLPSPAEASGEVIATGHSGGSASSPHSSGIQAPSGASAPSSTHMSGSVPLQSPQPSGAPVSSNASGGLGDVGGLGGEAAGGAEAVGGSELAEAAVLLV